MAGFCSKGLELFKEMAFCPPKTLPPYNDDLVRQVLEECREHERIFQDLTSKAKAAAQAELQAQQEAQGDQENGLAEPQVAQLMWDRHQDAVCAAISHNQAICRNKRLLLAYNNLRLERIKAHRWYSRALPDDFRQSMSPGEHQFWKKYDKTLSDFMRNGMGISLDLTADLEPPCDPTVQVKVERDFGAIVDADGTTHLDKGTVLSMSREEAEPLIRQGILSLWHQEGYRI